MFGFQLFFTVLYCTKFLIWREEAPKQSFKSPGALLKILNQLSSQLNERIEDTLFFRAHGARVYPGHPRGTKGLPGLILVVLAGL